MGPGAVENDFTDARMEQDIYGIYADTFFRVVQTEGRPTGQLKPQVAEWIKNLYYHKNCSRYLHDFLHVVQKRMMPADPDQRCDAQELLADLTRLRHNCLRDPSYYASWDTQPDRNESLELLAGVSSAPEFEDEGGKPLKESHRTRSGPLAALFKVARRRRDSRDASRVQ
jgi:hypothetical protein